MEGAERALPDDPNKDSGLQVAQQNEPKPHLTLTLGPVLARRNSQCRYLY